MGRRVDPLEGTTGRPVAHLYSAQTQLQYPVLALFDLSALRDIGIDPNTAPQKQRIHTRCWAYYQVSDKVKRSGNPYRDVTHLEPLSNGQAAQATSDEACPERSDRILSVIHDMHRMIAQLESVPQLLADIRQTVLALRFEDRPDPDRNGPEDEEPADQVEPVSTVDEDPVLRYGDGHAVADNEAELAAFVAFLESVRRAPEDIQELRRWKVAQMKEAAVD